MSTQEVVAVVTALVAVAALALSIVTALQNRRDVAAAAVASAQARAVAERHARAAEEAAQSAALTAEAVQALAEELRRRRSPTLLATRPEGPTLRLERRRGHILALVNQGGQTLTGVSLETDHPADLVRNLPTAETLPPGEALVFLLAGSPAAPVPREVLVRWDQQPEGTPLPLPSPAGPSAEDPPVTG